MLFLLQEKEKLCLAEIISKRRFIAVLWNHFCSQFKIYAVPMEILLVTTEICELELIAFIGSDDHCLVVWSLADLNSQQSGWENILRPKHFASSDRWTSGLTLPKKKLVKRHVNTDGSPFHVRLTLNVLEINGSVV